MKKTIIILFLLMHSCLVCSQVDDTESNYISYGELIDSLESVVEKDLVNSEVLKREFEDLQKSHGISNNQKMYHDFVRVRLAFEATRDSGLWQIRWAVTNKEPNSDLIWAQWNTLQSVNYHDENKLQPTAVAECDELSALFALIARGLGVKEVGLFWPTFNHTVAVWMAEDSKGSPVRVVIPTSQIFLTKNASLGTKEFDPYKQKTIYQYRRKDIKNNHKIPEHVAKMMISQVEKYGAEPSSSLQGMRNQRSQKFGGS